MKALILITLGASTAFAQLPEAPKTHLSREVRTLAAADGLLRIADGITTYRFLSDPCKCFHEVDPIAPKSANIPAIIGFQAAAFLAVQGGALWMDRLGHHRIARIARWVDVGSESYAVGNNIRNLRK